MCQRRESTRDGKLKIDIRGDGGFVIAPGSVHASGAVYRFAGDWTLPRERVPIFSLGWVPPPASRPSPEPRFRPTVQRAGQGAVVDRARRYLAAIPPPVIGQGSDAAVFAVACKLARGFALSPIDAESLIWEWAGGRPGWTREWIADKVSHANRYGTEPVGGLRR